MCSSMLTKSPMLGFVLIASFLTVLTGRALSAAQGGTGNGTSASRSQSRTSRSVTVNENGRQVSITENDEGISVLTSETIDGVEKKTEVRASSVKQLQAESPEVFELYKRHLRNAHASATTRTGATTSLSRTLMQQSSSRQSATAGGSATSRGRAGTSLRSGGGSGTTGGFSSRSGESSSTGMNRTATFTNDGKTVTIAESPSGISVSVTAMVDGVEKKTEVKAANAEELARVNPELYRLYREQFGAGQGNAAPFGGVGGPNAKQLLHDQLWKQIEDNAGIPR